MHHSEKRAARRAAAEADAEKRAQEDSQTIDDAAVTAAYQQEAPAWLINGPEQQILQLEMYVSANFPPSSLLALFRVFGWFVPMVSDSMLLLTQLRQQLCVVHPNTNCRQKRSASQVGFSLASVPAELKTGGLYVSSVDAHSAAGECGLMQYDRLLEVNDESVRRMSEVETTGRLDRTAVGSVVTLLVARDASVAARLRQMDQVDPNEEFL